MPSARRVAARLLRRSAPAAAQAALDDLAAAHHQTAHGVRELHEQVAALQALVDPARLRAVADTVEAMLPLLESALTASDAATRRDQYHDHRFEEIAATIARLDQAVDALGVAVERAAIA